MTRRGTARFEVKELGPQTWPDFVRIMDKHNGVWSGCWCTSFHFAPGASEHDAAWRRGFKATLVRENRSHAALVYEGTDIVGWCQFGPPSELPARMGGLRRLGLTPPDWRLTCFFVDRDHRRDGVARAALAGALRLIAAAGGGTVEGYPIAVQGRPYSSSFLWSGTESMFSEAGFKTTGSLGASKRVMRKAVRGRSGVRGLVKDHAT